ncbi:MAG: hypothetical protein R2754_18950 [Microthrixaceae bacterium]
MRYVSGIRGKLVSLAVVAVAGVLGGCGCAAAPPKAQPEGSGCTNVGNDLKGGQWFGVMKPGSTTSNVRFDLVCLFVDQPELAAAEDGKDPTKVYNLYVRNQSSRVRAVPVCEGASAFLVDRPNLPNHKPVSVQDYLNYLLDRPGHVSEVTVPIANHCISSMSELYTP